MRSRVPVLRILTTLPVFAGETHREAPTRGRHPFLETGVGRSDSFGWLLPRVRDPGPNDSRPAGFNDLWLPGTN